jgi:hypothetical protein
VYPFYVISVPAQVVDQILSIDNGQATQNTHRKSRGLIKIGNAYLYVAVNVFR